MIRALRGAVLEYAEGQVILDVGGVGYQVFIPSSAVASLPAAGGEISLFIHTHVREDAIHLYGFPTRLELRMFETLLGVGGIGPKLGLVILSHLSPEAIAHAVASGEERAFTKIPGIGKKTAARMLLELKDRIKGIGLVQSELRSTKTTDVTEFGDAHVSDAIAALVALGFAEDDASDAVGQVAAAQDGEQGDVQELIKAALKYLDRAG